ncbi:hypothetical protein CMK18_20865 [Candidatus Poribacteria bacterium]|nr:hypothetical protein [Candidatus Poribacteria bacterium]
MKFFYQQLLNRIKSSANPCYVYYDQVYYYSEMYQNMLKINNLLKDFKQKKIILFSEKSFETYCSLFAIILSENIWIQANPLYPEEHIVRMLHVSEPEMMLTDQAVPPTVKDFCSENQIKIVMLDEVLSGDNFSDISLGNFRDDDIAYIMFTSGSTGTPKGVPMTHQNYIQFIYNALEILPFDKGEVFSDFHYLGFDISIFYLFCAVLTESALAPVLEEGEKFFPLDNIIQNKVTVWSSVPSTIARIMKLRPTNKVKTNIKIMFLCGEPFRLEVLRYCYENLNLTHVYNFYGLTETGVENFFHECERTDLERFRNHGFVPIGKPLPGNEIKVLENKELLIAGCQVTPGYLGEIDSDKFSLIDGERWFHSGDIVELSDDVYFCKGRVDTQVKLSGYRVELMDIEVHIRKFRGALDAICFVDDRNREHKVLRAVIEADEKFPVNLLKQTLKKSLPNYMIPSTFSIIAEFPRNKNGKIDRKQIKMNTLKKI